MIAGEPGAADTRRLLIGCIADDFTGGTDIGNTLAREGLDVIQTVGVPGPHDPIPATDALVVALKSRTIPVADAVGLSSEALAWLRARGAEHIYFKYCSTFDSRPDGNIGPVADRLLDDLGSSFTVVCPAFPETGRTVFQGHLFVGDRLLAESSMARHPLTPMTDSNVVRLLAAQTRRTVALVPHDIVDRGASALATRLDQARHAGIGYAVVDATSDRDLRTIAEAAAGLELVTGASGLARGLPAAYGHEARPVSGNGVVTPRGPAAVIAGSASQATREQVRRLAAMARTVAVDPRTWRSDLADDVIAEALAAASEGPLLVHAINEPDAVADAQRELGVAEAGAIVERALAAIAVRLVGGGIRRIVVAGGETSAAVVQALGVTSLRIGAEIAPGVPACVTLDERPLALVLKSGNFGGPDFFLDALRALP